MPDTIVKWVLKDGIKGTYPLFLSQKRHGYGMVELGDEDMLILHTREIARDFSKGFRNLLVKKLTMTVE